jgi:hypothetical protein
VSATEGSRRTGHKGLLRTEYEMVNFCEFDSKGTLSSTNDVLEEVSHVKRSAGSLLPFCSVSHLGFKDCG